MKKVLPLLALALLAGHAQAQVYRCQIGTRWVISDRPCDPNAGKLGGFGPLPERPAQSQNRPIPEMQRAPDYLARMSPQCASLHDGLRTAEVRGVSRATQAEMRRNYDSNCREDEMRAQQQLQDGRSEAKSGQRQQQRLAQAQSEREQVYCAGLGDVIRARTREARPEDAQLARYRQTYTERCAQQLR